GSVHGRTGSGNGGGERRRRWTRRVDRRDRRRADRHHRHHLFRQRQFGRAGRQHYPRRAGGGRAGSRCGCEPLMTRDVESMVFGRNGYFPNSDLPVLVYRQAVEGAVTAEAVQSAFARNGWPPRWVDTIFDYYHYHSTAHEALGVVSGTGELAV